MAKCAICGKGAHFGNNVSHSHRRSNKMWKSNIKSVRIKVNGAAKKTYEQCVFLEKEEADYFIESIEMIFQTVYYEENDRGDAIMQEVHSDIFILGAGAGGFGGRGRVVGRHGGGFPLLNESD